MRRRPWDVCYMARAARADIGCGAQVGTVLAGVCWAAAAEWAQGQQWQPALGAAQLALSVGTQRSRHAASSQLHQLQQCAEQNGAGDDAAAAIVRLVGEPRTQGLTGD